MSLSLYGTEIRSVLVVDDDPAARASCGERLNDFGLDFVSEDGPIESAQDYVMRRVRDGIQAVMCDYQLRQRNYSALDGAALVAEFYSQRFPAILCTKFDVARADEIRSYRRQIPVVLNPTDLDEQALEIGFSACIREFRGDPPAARKAWRTLVRVEEFDPPDQVHRRVFVVVPAWNSNKVVSMMLSDLPPSAIEAVDSGVTRFFAEVNTSAQSEMDLYFGNWQIPSDAR